MKILVTGATGFIGNHLVPRLLERGHSVVAVARDEVKASKLTWYADVQFLAYDIYAPDFKPTLAQFGNPEALAHLAWTGLPNYNALFHLKENLPADYRFIRSLIDQGLKQIMVTGTCFEYGMQNGCLTEEMATQPANPYAQAKDTLRKSLQLLQQQSSFVLQWARLFYMYGPGQNPNSLLAQLDNAIDKGESVFNMSGGEQLRDYLPVEEVASRLVSLLENMQYDGIFNICSGEPISVRRMVEKYLSERRVDIQLKLGHYPYSDNEPMAFWGKETITLSATGSNSTKSLGDVTPDPIRPLSRIFYTKPSITEIEIQYGIDAVTNGWGERCHDYIAHFENLFCEHLGVKHAVATSSCTGALHMGLTALGVGQGDEVILGDINWIASGSPITYLGAKPILVDVLPDTWCIDPAKVKAAITSRTKAIIAVHLYGNLCDMDALRAIGDQYGIPIVEDSAEALGSQWHGQKAGSMGSFGTFSFHGTKTITTGEGGMFVTQDDDLFEKVLTLNNHGRARAQKKQFWSDKIGFKYKMSNLQAAIGCAQIERMDELLEGKRRIFEYYLEQLNMLPLKMNPEPVETRNGFWMPTILVDEGIFFDRETLLETFKAEKIDARVFFWPLSMLPMFESKPGNRVSYSLYNRGLNLPSYHDLKEVEMDRVISCLRNFIRS
tara:strand:- start:4300 stop:6297 length:1998 start_codon:yes stop_codon:yes gene_type:complete